jgi:multiple antibiotic resistance protein
MGSETSPAGTVAAFLLAFPALFSIINPIGGALIFSEVTAGRSHDERARLARGVGIYSFCVLIASIWAGSYVLAFFGISLGALRVAGGIVVAIAAWRLLMSAEAEHSRKQQQADPGERTDDIAFFPLTIPLTTGPGTISVAIALASTRPATGGGTLRFFLGVTLAAAALAIVIWLAYREADRLVAALGHTGARILSRLAAFLLLCIGVQIVWTGVENLVGPLLGHPIP